MIHPAHSGQTFCRGLSTMGHSVQKGHTLGGHTRASTGRSRAGGALPSWQAAGSAWQRGAGRAGRVGGALQAFCRPWPPAVWGSHRGTWTVARPLKVGKVVTCAASVGIPAARD